MPLAGGAKPDPAEKPRKIPDCGGLCLVVSPSGGALWRRRCRFDGKEKLLWFGAFPETSLANARALRDKAAALRGALKPPTRVKHMARIEARIEARQVWCHLQKRARDDRERQTLI